MVQLAGLFLSLVAISSSVYAAPLVLEKRIDQTISASTAKWQAACVAAGGGQDKCSSLSVTAFTTLLAGVGPCDQQNAADGLMNLSKQLNSQEMITLAQIFVQQPRNSPDSVATPYCQQTPQNAELNGLFQCQFQGSNQNSFDGGAKLGDAGTIPLGLTAPLNPLGSCPANTAGPIADGTQLVDLTTNPGTVGGGGAAPPQAAAPAIATAPVIATAQATPSADATLPAATGTPALTATLASAGDFHLQNGKDAQALNKKFAALSATSSCTTGDTACINGGFAQCVGGKFTVTSCGALSCFALPLDNSPGTSVACDTEADAVARIAASGATGGLTGA